ncbi:uncharacterized protein LOC115445810 isoform X2 [Manduca sexta]|uniref:uncharacterized protein LOC115445810 isoform X2 n=1 Tax=Manduca sexta TaxID=7130 RepID=UPI00188F4E2F|nr:uncharacterized protein LOC115445810 isoform X2 [Manduca sexta]
MAQSRSSAKFKELLRQKSATVVNKDDSGCDTSPEDNLDHTSTQYPDSDSQTEGNKHKAQSKPRSTSSITLRSTNRNKDTQFLPDVGGTGISPTTHSNMKTKQAKEEQDKTLDEETVIEPKTRARKKASDIANDDKTKPSQDEPKTSKETKKVVNKPKAIVKKRPMGIRKTLRSKKTIATRDKVKNAIKKTVTRGRKAAVKLEPDNSQEKETVPLIPASEIKKEPLDDTPNSRSSSPKTAGRRQRLSSDLVMMKTMLSDSQGSLVLGPRTSPYPMRSERSNSPSMFEAKNLRSGKSKKVKNNLLNEVVMKEQKKRRRLLSDSKTSDFTDAGDECKKLKRGRSCSRDGSEISKCSDNTESDMSLSEPLEEGGKELNKKLDKSKTDLDVDIENNVQISSIEKVPSVNDDKHSEPKAHAESSCVVNEKNKKKLSLKRSTSLDSDNNNSNRIKLDNLNSSEIESKLLLKTENDTLLDARSSILSSMSKTFNTKEITKNIKKAHRGRRAAALARPDPNKACMVATISNSVEDKQETIESLSKEIDDLINNLDENIDQDTETSTTENTSEPTQTKHVSKFYGSGKPLSNSDDNNITRAPDTPVKNTELSISVTNENTPSKIDDSETIRLHYEEDSEEKTAEPTKHEITYNCTSVASIDKLMDRLKEFEEFDKRRQRQESESKANDTKPMMVTSDVVLIPKSGADIKPLKDIQSVRSPERPIEKENVLSCFENNSAISILKRDQVRKSIDVDLPNSVTLIKRNSFSARKESISSNHSRESDAISIFEKSLGKDVTLTEIRKSVEKSAPVQQVELHFATLHPNNPGQNLVPGVVLDSNEISITPRVMTDKSNINDIKIIPKRKSRESISRKSSESTNDEDKLTIIEKIKAPSHPNLSPAVSISATPVAIKSPESTPMETEALPPPLENIKPLPQDASLTSEVSKICNIKPTEASKPELPSAAEPIKTETESSSVENKVENVEEKVEKTTVPEIPVEEQKEAQIETELKLKATVESEIKGKTTVESEFKVKAPVETEVKVKGPKTKSARNSTETQAGPSNSTVEVADKKKRKDLVRKISTTSQKDVTDEKTEKAQNEPNCADRLVTNEPEKVTEQVPTVEEKPVVAEPESKRAKSPKTAKVETQPGPSNVFNETPETKKHKEYVLRTLGLLTHKAAKEAKIEKLKEKERIYGGIMSNKSKSAKAGLGDYTGTLKTVIKLNRGAGDRDKKKQRTSLKMTFQKSKYRSGKPTPDVGDAANEDEYYTIERREGVAGAATDGGHRKSHYSNRLNNHEAVPEPAEAKEGNLVIPEKASSFSIHPGRLCMDQCFYCGGKFGLFDTPCHIAQIKSSERQKKILDNEEKLTIDSCLCDACYRHVDRRANCPSYRKRPPGRQPDAPPGQGDNNLVQTEKPVSPPLEEESEEEPTTPGVTSGRVATCHTEGCVAAADYSIRRKWLIKMRSSVNKVLKLKCDYPGLHTLPLCAAHHRALAPLMACALCRRRLTKHHNLHFINHGFLELNPLLTREGVPVQFSERPVLCKGCRYYCTLLQRPGHNDHYARAYRRKLLQVYNIEVPPEPEHEGEEMTTLEDPNNLIKPSKKKQRTKSKQRKSTEPEQSSESSEKTNESTPEKEKIHDDSEPSKESTALREEEDIESLISSNKILVPGAVKSNESMTQSDGSENENVCEFDTPFLHVDKQTELQYLLQKQNNPAQFLPKTPNLTQKQRNIMKIQNVSGVQKPGQQHRISEKNAKKIHKIGQMAVQKDKIRREDDDDRSRDGIPILKNINLNDECTIETIPNKRTADINTLKNKWQLSESFTQVKKNLSELSKKLTIEKDPKKPSEAKYSNPVKRLETNPSISVRELFPGEEEMNLQCNIEFNNVKGVTPEGWEKCNTMIQYDVETRKLWTELQRPYGNQSSFLRHLILLEKYFRSGDLVLSHNASPHAANYSDSVQSRLRAYDNVVNDTPRRNEPAISLIEFRKKPSMNGKSLLKSNQNEPEKDTKKFMPPPPMLPKPKVVKEKQKSKPLPPELIAINTPNAQGRKAIQNVLHNIQQLVKGVSASDPTEVAAAPLPPPKFEAHKEKKESPKTETPKKIKATSKPWRPTLMPITQENLAKIAREPTQVAVDGRTLPSLVQVMSSGKRYHITLQDYNKMCIMRREKLQQLREGDKKRNSTEETTVVTEIQPSTMLGNGGTVVQNIVEERQEKKEVPELGQIGNAATILKNACLKNITIAPIPPKTATVTSMTLASPVVTSPSLLVTSTPIKIPQLGSAVSITSETVLTPNAVPAQLMMPKIPKSLTVIPQTIMGGTVTTAVSTMAGGVVPDPQRP